SNTIKNWIDGTEVNGTPTSAAFDFQFRYTVRNAINGGNWINLGRQNDGSWPLVSGSFNNGSYRQWAVTFVENHDTEYRSSTAQQDPIRKDTLAANAYLLAMPGTPCVFYKHWLAYKDEIKAMTAVRKGVGIHNMSSFFNMASNVGYYAVNVTGTNGKLLAVVGNAVNSYTPNASTWTKVLSGYHYAYYLINDMNTAWVDLASGKYTEPKTATLTAVTDENAKLVYTTDGSNPTANSTKVESGARITIPAGTTTLKVGLLIGSAVSGIITRSYDIEEPLPFDAYDITVHVNADVWGTTLSSVNFWTWGGDGSHAPGRGWPGDAVSTKKTINGKNWFYKTFRINAADDAVNFVFSKGTGSPQTVDIENVNQDAYFEILSTTTSGKNEVNDVSSVYSGIEGTTLTKQEAESADNTIYDLSGRKIANLSPRNASLESLPKGIYITNGRRVVIK
ncbi:MAG: chitobiase/beta-hexosaminidase C-terminal domain-containing protein, partial [Prevotella sp.]|nr:chitobiase/beta-hexosaminidase C-terminal domain-containing protein [Prevotella sp.]